MTQRPRGSIFPPQLNGGARVRALAEPATAAPTTAPAPAPAPKPPATESLAQRTGALVNEIDFPGFVAGLVHGTFDAIVDASIRQMESYSSLVSAVAKTVDQFTEENVSPNQARDWLAQRYPGEVRVAPPTAEQPAPVLVPVAEGLTPAWLADYGIDGEELTSELLEERVLPQVRTHVGSERQQLLATMVMLGMNRVAVRDGSITAKVMFRASANDSAKVGYATGSDPKSVADWGERGSLTYSGGSSTMVSTLGVNAQSDTSLRADLFGEVKLNFVSETLPLDKLADAAKIALVQRNAAVARPAPAPALPAPAPAPAAPAAPATGPAGGA
ncbi:hypothetical protein [Piscinibacter terrae]|uniref:Uncharacterized protein n=1 Tax=Piscinibacter terrae TaxID=2496871 RepID=A0A3N7JVY5_9BURK|nr:hypothetical protein [Albitalea terrae]RQP23035.1 hypothetical protein DZC73_18070 [Albitalea terrae]